MSELIDLGGPGGVGIGAMDTVPTEGSVKQVNSGGVFTAIQTEAQARDAADQELADQLANIPETDTTDIEADISDLEGDVLAIGLDIAELETGKQPVGNYSVTGHSHTSTSISDFTEAVQDAVAGLLGAGSNITVTYNDAANTFTIEAAGTPFDPEAVRDAIGAALIPVGNIGISINDAGDTITISTTATVNSTDAVLLARTNHTGVMPDSGLSANVVLRDSAQTLSGAKTFSTQLTIAGSSDTSQLLVKSNATQTTPFAVFANSANATLLTLSYAANYVTLNTGAGATNPAIYIPVGIRVANNGVVGNAAAGGNLKFNSDGSISVQNSSNVDYVRFYSATGSAIYQNAGTFTEVASSQLTVNSTTKGILAPRMTKVQRDAIASPAQGLMVYVTDNGGYMSYYEAGWKKVSSVAD